MKKINYILYTLCLLVLAQACKQEEPAKPVTGIILTVKDASAAIIPNASVYLFEDGIDFATFVGNTSLPNLAIQQGFTDANGQIRFWDLNTLSNYHFYVEKNNTNNADGSFQMGNVLVKNAIHYVSITLDGFVRKQVKFVSTDPSVMGNKLTIYLQGSSLNTIAAVGDAGSYIYAPNNGTYTYYIKNENGCIWQKSITVSDNSADVQTITLEPCGEASFTFVASNTKTGNVKIYLNNEVNPIGTISATNGTLTVYRPAGTYTYKAEYQTGSTCTWIGQINGGTTANLDKCQ